MVWLVRPLFYVCSNLKCETSSPFTRTCVHTHTHTQHTHNTHTHTHTLCAVELHADPLPLEQHMEVSHSVRTEKFFDLIEEGDIVRGHVRKKLPFALEGKIDSFVGLDKKRFISDLGVRCHMKITELDKSTSDQQVAYQDFQQGDVFKGHALLLCQPRHIGLLGRTVYVNHA